MSKTPSPQHKFRCKERPCKALPVGPVGFHLDLCVWTLLMHLSPSHPHPLTGLHIKAQCCSWLCQTCVAQSMQRSSYQLHQHVVLPRPSCTCLKSISMSDHRLDISSGWDTLATANTSLSSSDRNTGLATAESAFPHHNQELLKQVSRPPNDLVLVS